MGDADSPEPKPLLRSTVLSLFPTLVWRAELRDDARDGIRRGLLEMLGEMTSALREPPPGGSWQSGHDLHQRAALAELVAVVQRMTTAVLGFLHIGYDSFEITGCWANVSGPAAAHAIHHHPNNFLTGVYYVCVDDGCDTIQFHDPRAQVGVIRPPVRELSGETTDMVVVRVQPGTILLFPSWLDHSVPPNRSPLARVSVSFNLMFSRYTETMASPMWEPGYRPGPLGR